MVFLSDSDCLCIKASAKPVAIRIKAINRAIKLLDLERDFIKLHWLLGRG